MIKFSSNLLLSLAQLFSGTLAELFSLNLAQTISSLVLSLFALISLFGLLEFGSAKLALAGLLILLSLAEALALQKLARFAQLTLLVLLNYFSSNLL